MRNTAEWYRGFAEGEARGRSAVYEAWASGIADDPELLALIERLPETTRQPSLVFAVARLLGAPEGGFVAFKQWMLGNWARVRPQVASHLNQTNEPGRCASLLPALAALPGALALLEIGASGGLCLYPDRYSYLYDDGTRIDPADGSSTVLLRCATNGHVPLPPQAPEVVWRAGIDLAPLDVTDADDRRWLETLAWPEEHERRERIRAAMDIARRDAPLLVKGQATDALVGLAAQAPAGAPLVVITSGVLVYLPFLERQRFIAAVRELCAASGAHWLSLEGIDVLPRVKEALPQGDGRFVLALDEHPLAWSGPHGQSLDWLPG
ncbi:DUF2332 domain-containing protein [Parafrigoribacterium soli]|uniref:DUF2332 domain-containing protein n=1 Tax=Parafrigoribacterium soli TaxID=3144663 RepID=UPI0032F04D8D